MPDFGMRLLKSATSLSGIDLLAASLSTVLLFVFFIVCVYSNSRNDFPRVAQRYGTIAAHTRHRASVLVVFVVFFVHVYSFAGLIRRTPPLTFSDSAITDRHSDTTIFQLRAHCVRISWSIGSEKLFGHVPRWESNPRLPACKANTPSTRPGSPLVCFSSCCCVPILLTTFPPNLSGTYP